MSTHALYVLVLFLIDDHGSLIFAYGTIIESVFAISSLEIRTARYLK